MKKITRRNATTTLIDTSLHPILLRVLQNRGVTTLSALDKNLQALTHYRDLKDIGKAVERLFLALERQQRVLIVGDFDADGATSTALAVSCLRNFGFNAVEYLVPNRFKYGYGLTPEIVEVALKWDPKLIITVDNGIASIDGVSFAKSKGIDVLITDHHLPGNELPEACAIVNPNQKGCPFTSKSVAGVGVIFYVMLALRAHLLEKDYFNKQGMATPNMGEYLDLVALGTVADVVPLDKNNRVLVYQGLKRIQSGKARSGINALLKVANRDAHHIKASCLGFALGPRLNAAGRLDDMSLGIECLLAKDKNKALNYALELDNLNKERREIEASMKQEALNTLKKLQLSKENLPLGLCLYDKQWHQGVIGIVAGRLKEQFARPCIVFANGEQGSELKGSARSIAGLNIRDLLDNIATLNPGLINKFGGHAMAAGLSIEESKFEDFKQAFNSEVLKHLNQEQCVNELLSDGSLSGEDFNLDLIRLLEQAGPWGQQFQEPLFDNIFELVEQRLVGGKHLKVTLKLEDSFEMIDGIYFNIDETLWPNHRAQKVHAAYRLDINRYQGRERLQLMIEHLIPM